MPLLSLPNELLLQVAEKLGPKDLSHFIQANNFLARLLTPVLHGHALRDGQDMPALFWAVMMGHQPLVSLILDNGADVHMFAHPQVPMPKFPESREGLPIYNKRLAGGHARQICPCQNALQWAVTCQRLEIVRLLLERGADVNAQQQQHQCDMKARKARQHRVFWAGTALHYAVVSYYGPEKCREDIVGLLLQSGADIYILDTRSWDALYNHLSRGIHSEDIIRQLIGNGADINADSYHYAPLWVALRGMHIRKEGIFRLLIEMGADTTIRGHLGVTILHHVIKERGPLIPSEGYSMDLIKLFVYNSENINSQDSYGQTALHYAVARGGGICLGLVEFLLENGIDSEIQDDLGRTALDLAILHKRKHVAACLSSLGCTKDI